MLGLFLFILHHTKHKFITVRNITILAIKLNEEIDTLINVVYIF